MTPVLAPTALIQTLTFLAIDLPPLTAAQQRMRERDSARVDPSLVVFAGLSALSVAKFVLPLPAVGLLANHV
jgi:hypothetical protein